MIDIVGDAQHTIGGGSREAAAVVLGGNGTLGAHEEAIAPEEFIQLPPFDSVEVRAGADGLRLLLITGGSTGDEPGRQPLQRRVERIAEIDDNPFHDPAQGFLHMSARWLVDSDHGRSSTYTLGQSSFAAQRGSHELHRHPGGQEFFYILQGEGAQLTEDGEPVTMAPGDLVFVPRNEWHGFRNTGSSEVRAIFGYLGAESLEAGGYELP